MQVENCTTASKPGCLFKISEDPEERHDLGADPAHEQRVSTMLRSIVTAREAAFNPDRGRSDSRACQVALGKYGGFWGPFAT